MNHRDQKNYLDAIKLRLTLRYGRKPHERNLDKVRSEPILQNRPKPEKSETAVSTATSSSGVSLLESNNLKPSTNRIFIKKASYYNHQQHQENRRIAGKRQNASSGY